MERHHSDIIAAGLAPVAVGIGEPKHARHYCPRLAPSLTCVVGQSTEAHTAYGLRRGTLLQFVGPQAAAASLKVAAQGFLQGAATGDAAMLSGTFVVTSDGVIQYAYYGEHAGDHPDLGELLQALARQRA